MSITENPEFFRIKTTPGMNNKVEDLDLQDKWVETAQNCRFEDEPGSVDKRPAVTYYNSTTIGTGAVTGLHRFYSSGGTIKFVCSHGTQVYVGDDGAGTWTSIRTGLTDGKRMAFEVYKDRCIFPNGFDNPFVYDGSSDNVTWELGACKALLSTAGAGNLDSSANYYYAVTFDTDATVNGAVSNTVATDGSNQQIELSDIPLGPSGTTNRRIYRTVGGGSTLLLLATISDNTTTTYTDNIGDGSLSSAMPVVTDDMPKGSIIKIHRERLFITGDPNNPSKIYYGRVYLPHYIRQTSDLDYMEISPEDGDEIMGIPIQLGVMVCIKKNTIRKLHITSPTSGADPTTWYADDPIAWIGSPAQWSITQTPYGIIFLGWDHWYRFDGATTTPIIDEFDTGDILPASFSDVVGFFHQGIMLAAYTDNTTAAQFHDRIMRYNFKRQALSYDLWTSSTISGANCFASKSGDDETGELYYGDSVSGYVLKEKSSGELYRLKTKTECNDGGQTNVFIGGTETAPYIEIGGTQAASAIPDDICIFWDDETTTPGSEWTEVTGSARMVYVSTTAGTTSDVNSTHTHNISGTLLTSNEPKQDGGDSDAYCTRDNHSHVQSAEASDATTAYPRWVKFRCFKASSATVTEFPDGAIVMYDQPTAPTGWATVAYEGYYVRIDTSGLDSPTSSSHNHPFDITCDAQGNSEDSGTHSDTTHHSSVNHTHDSVGTSDSTVQDDWELAYCSFTFIKKTGEADTWDGTLKYVYALYDGAGAPSGWEDMSATYTGRYLKIASSTPTTGAAANAAHTHIIQNGWSTYHLSTGPVYGGYHHQMIENHRHTYDLDAASGSQSAAPYRSFKIYRKLLGKMKSYNSGRDGHQATGTWTSPSLEINAESLGSMLWNESITAPGTDNILIHTRTGATQVACEAAGWSAGLSDPNGSPIVSSANVWLQYKIEFTAGDTTSDIPRAYFTDAFVAKFSYEKGNVNAETSVNWIYGLGFRNFDQPLNDKAFKKIGTVHTGSAGSFTFSWETENANNSFPVDLTANGSTWNSFFQDTAMGAEAKFTVSKNDLYDFKLKEIKGAYTQQPLIM